MELKRSGIGIKIIQPKKESMGFFFWMALWFGLLGMLGQLVFLFLEWIHL